VTDAPLSTVTLTVDGETFELANDGRSLLDALRGEIGALSVKDGCSPQGQCGCCTVMVDGAPRVSCVTPLRRVQGRDIITVDGIDEDSRLAWAAAFADAGASQCGFCTPGIICRLEGLKRGGGDLGDPTAVNRSLQAHLCRCTGWSTIRDAAAAIGTGVTVRVPRDVEAAERRANVEGRTHQHVGPDVALGRGGFADDTAPRGSLVAVPDGDGWHVGESLFEARSAVVKVQGRRTTLGSVAPVELPEGQWDTTLQTSWVEPAYLETDVVWCEPGALAVGPLRNGGAFGAKHGTELASVARRLADKYQRPVRVVTDREWVVRNGPKRPPVAIGITAAGAGVFRVARTTGIRDIIKALAPDLTIEEVDIAGPPTSSSLRAAGWAEIEMINTALRGETSEVLGPDGGAARAEIDGDIVRVAVRAGDVLDEVVLRSYIIGAAHMALGWIRSESLAVDNDGVVHDLTIRSFGVLKATETPPIEVEIDTSPGDPVNVSDAAFVAVAAAAWLKAGTPAVIPDR